MPQGADEHGATPFRKYRFRVCMPWEAHRNAVLNPSGVPPASLARHPPSGVIGVGLRDYLARIGNGSVR